ncbi:MAG TPA: c-type cytochrome [Bradyrhizobium sp.]|uniref:c-type cytochrome n=1 Tax=Bradyrhizobium sp. TaxID=376 RepID=UPI002B7466EA|nr:c-type cytochrome [Bradyrhizobium sp.]HLZ01919.1 c-type cytochrome [Bradyrhizobium sp.]
MLRTSIGAIGLACVISLISSGALAETAIERGDYLVNTIMACGNCHSPRDAKGVIVAEKALSGGLTFDTPAFLATAPNITPDKQTGIGAWTDQEIKRALIEGIRPDHGKLAGAPLAAIMPANFYKALLPDDLAAIIAYLRTVKPVRHEVAPPVYRLPVRREPYPDAEAGFTGAMMTDPVKHGAYLATIGHCMECHAAWSKGVHNYTTGLGKGGRAFPLREGAPDSPTSIAANITSDPTEGIGAWSDAEIARAITHGISRDGHALKPPMAFGFYAGLKDPDLKDIIAYLRTVPPLD